MATSLLGGTMNRAQRRAQARAVTRTQDMTSAVDRSVRWLNQAVAHHQGGALDRAETFYRQVLDANPRQINALNNLALILGGNGDFDTALMLLDHAIQADPEFAEAHANRGVTLNHLGRYEDALAAYGRAAAIVPDNPTVHYNMANALQALGRMAAACAAFERAIALKPDYVEAHCNLGNALKAAGRLADALNVYQRAIALNPDFAEAHYNHGMTLHEAGRFEEAVAACRRAIRIRPDYADAYGNLGTSLQALGRLDEALAAHRRAVAINPAFAEGHANVGSVLMKLDRPQEALDAYRRAVGARADYAAGYHKMGNALHRLGRPAESAKAQQRAIAIQPDYADAHLNRAMALLLDGQLAEGWREYEWRHRANGSTADNADFQSSAWDGSSLSGKSLLVRAEQGVGDEIMFASLMPDLAPLAARLVVECDSRLKPLFARSLPGIEWIEVAAPSGSRSLSPLTDWQCRAAGLCRYLRSSPSAFPERGRFLVADPDAVAAFRDRYRMMAGDRTVVGLSWHSNNPQAGKRRSLPLDQWGPVLANRRCWFVNLQYGDVRAALADLTGRTGAEIYLDGDVDPLTDLDRFAAQVAALDLVVSVDNTTVHMAGALGVPIWTLLNRVPDWRWQMRGERTPWYPDMRLFRQSAEGEWAGVVDAVGRTLARMLPAGTGCLEAEPFAVTAMSGPCVPLQYENANGTRQVSASGAVDFRDQPVQG